MTELVSEESTVPALLEVNTLIDDEEEAENKFLTFKIGDELFGTDIGSIQEIIEYSAMTRVPLTPSHIRGVSNLRGNVVPIVDMAVRLGKEGQSKVTKRTCIIIVEMDDEDEKIDIGFVVDEVDEVLDIRAESIEPAPQFGTDIRSEFINGMGKVDGEFVILLLLNEILSVKDLSALISSDDLSVN